MTSLRFIVSCLGVFAVFGDVPPDTYGLQEVKAELRDCFVQIRSHQGQNDECRNQLNSHQEALIMCQADVETSRKENQHLSNAISMLRQEIRDDTIQIEALSNELEALSNELSLKNQEVEEAATIISQQKQELVKQRQQTINYDLLKERLEEMKDNVKILLSQATGKLEETWEFVYPAIIEHEIVKKWEDCLLRHKIFEPIVKKYALWAMSVAKECRQSGHEALSWFVKECSGAALNSYEMRGKPEVIINALELIHTNHASATFYIESCLGLFFVYRFVTVIYSLFSREKNCKANFTQ